MLESRIGWEPSVVVENSHTHAEIEILIDYYNLPIQCKYCFAIDHCFRECPIRTGSGTHRIEPITERGKAPR
jgi:hypothetical protein